MEDKPGKSLGNVESLMNRNEGVKRSADKRRLVLRFLRDERWTHLDVIQKLLGIKTRQAAHKTMMKLERDELVRRHSVDLTWGRPVTLWSLTAHGAMMSFDLDEELRDVRVFEASKFNQTQMRHHLDLQLMKIKAEQAGWTGWCTSGSFAEKGVKNPDAVVKRPDGAIIAIELERTLKSLRRYPDVLISHLRARKQGLWDEVYYLSPDENIRNRVMRAFESVEEGSYKNQKIRVTDEHRIPFKFFTYDEYWESL